MEYKTHLFSFFGIALVLNCASLKREVRLQLTGAAYCLSSNVQYKYPVPNLAEIKKKIEDPILKTKYSQNSLKIAAAYGLIDDLKKHIELTKARKTQSSEFKELELSLLYKLGFIHTDLDSLVSEMNCYIDRFSEIINMMDENQTDIVYTYSIYAIMVGAAQALLEGIEIDSNLWSQRIVLTGGILATYFSYVAFTPEVTVEFRPKSTNLKDLWYKPEKTDNYSTSLWFLMTKNLEGEEKPTVRDFLINRWIENKFLGEEGEEREAKVELFFGRGGVSTIGDIRNRQEMIKHIRTTISIFEQDLRALVVEFMKE